MPYIYVVVRGSRPEILDQAHSQGSFRSVLFEILALCADVRLASSFHGMTQCPAESRAEKKQEVKTKK